MVTERVARAGAFARATRSYWTSVFPRVCRELRHWNASALAIYDPALRALALEALAKRGNMEGAAAFATFAPRAHRAAVVRATVAFQAAYNYLDVLSEQPSARPLENSRRLHGALLVALDCLAPAMGSPRQGDPAGQHVGCHGRHDRDDGGHLAAMVDACRSALAELPSYPAVAAAARRAAERVVAFQAFQACGAVRRESGAMEAWAREQTPPGADLRWWETAGSAGSSVGVHVMIAAAAEPTLDAAYLDTVERAYFPWIGALHTLLDHLIDRAEDAASGQCNLIGCYAGAEETARRMRLLAERALQCAHELPPGRRHALIVAAMASFYLSTPEARSPEVLPISHTVLDAFGPLVRPALAIFKARRTAERVYYACRLHGHDDTAAETLTLAAGHR